ncbi:MAG TPA: tetratricopeptide repeat protein [Vicinamibacterales bacterium]|nr:tetratricopeptide repeat protein [Vicinamibacterales bacterium]
MRATPRAPKRGARQSAPPQSANRTWLVFVVLVAITVLAYAPVWNGGMLWDDDAHVTRSALRSVEGLWRIWFEVGATQQYYPVLHSTFWALHRVFGDQTLGYHLVNATLHGLSAGLFVVLLRRLQVPGAILAGVVFALHPVHVESVAWISELKNTLSGFWYLGAALVYLRFDTERRGALYAGALLLFVLAVLTKSVTVTLPAALLVVLWWQRGSLRWREDVAPLVPFFVIGIAAGLGTIWVEREYIGASGPAFDFSFIERGLIAGRALVFYVATLLWPVNLTFVYPRWDVSQSVWWQYLFPLAVLIVLAWCWSVRTRTRAPLVVALLFAGTLFPALGFFNVYPFIFSFVADHFQYLASLSLIAGAAAGLATLSGGWRSGQPWRGPACIVAIAAVLATMTWRQSREYVGAEVLYAATIEKNPDAWMAHLNLGWLRLQRGELEAAVRDTETALRLEPNLPQGHNNLGSALRSLARFDAAERAYREALRLKPDDLDTRYNLGLVLIDLGRPGEATGHIQAYLLQHPEDAAAYGQLGDAHQSMNRLGDAIVAYRASIKINPRDARVRTNLGSALGREGRLPEAIAEFTEALRLDPTYEPAARNLALARSRLGGG